MKKKIALLMACVMAFGVAVGGTLAWLTDKTQDVKNVFTPSDINITLGETTKDYQMIPGHSIAKDPKVSVLANSEACWLFVKVTENLGAWDETKANDKFTDYLSYTIASGWTAGEGDGDGKNGVPVGVYFREVDTTVAETGEEWYVLAGTGDGDLKNGYITVNGANVTKEMMNEIDGKAADGTALEGAALKAETDGRPTLTFKAYASQLYTGKAAPNDKFTPAQAWTNITG